jgi:hypothetical protein
MKSVVIPSMLAVLAFPGASFSQPPPQEHPCTAYFGVLQDDPKAPGRYVARMTSSQANWYGNNGRKQYPGLCLSLEKARYLIVWTVSTRARTFQTTETRTAQVNTSATEQESGTFNTYGGLSTWGRYSGTSSSSSTSTITYQESVPVTVTADHCSIYVLKSVGPTVWDDIRNKTPQPFAIFSTEARGPNRASDTGGSAAETTGLILGTVISHALRREPTAHALDAALKFISTQRVETVPAQPVSSAPAATDVSVVSFKSTPEGAEITVDAKYVGNTPSVIRLTAGDHEIEILKLGFKAWKRMVTLNAGGEVTIDAALEKEPPQ